MSSRPRALLEASLQLGDSLWNESLALLRLPASSGGVRHGVRETAWYAHGLFHRAGPGDHARALRALAAVLDHQIHAPRTDWDGTFRRALEEPVPPADARCWEHYDPNWRQFIGVTLTLILLDFPEQVPAALRARVDAALRHAVTGELAAARLLPSYTNIALMHGFLLAFAGLRFDRPAWIRAAEDWARAVHAGFAPDETFEEYNSPTYYGVDLLGLALWRHHGPTDVFRTLGAAMEAGLWRDIGRFYHAGLSNLCGPYDRAYGLDLRGYVACVGIWIALAAPAHLAPLPETTAGPMAHAHDFLVTPCIVALGAKIPDDVLPHLHAFQGPRLLERRITHSRTATAWLSADLMLGGEHTSRTCSAGPGTDWHQFHPATAHWRTPCGGLGWLALRAAPPLDARAGENRLHIATNPGDAMFLVHAPGLAAAAFTHGRWTLPGLDVRVTTDAAAIVCVPQGDAFAVTYRAVTRLTFNFSR